MRLAVVIATLRLVSERAFDREDVRLLFEVLFDIKRLLAQLVDYVENGEDDGGEEEEETDEQ